MTHPDVHDSHLTQPVGDLAVFPDGRKWGDVVRQYPGWIANLLGLQPGEDV